MNNIYFSIDDDIDISNEIINNLNEDFFYNIKQSLNNQQDYISYDDKFNILYNEYMEHYNMNELKSIAGYYNLRKNRNKANLIDEIILYELDEQNKEIVSKRLMYWQYINELKNDKYFSKYIIRI